MNPQQRDTLLARLGFVADAIKLFKRLQGMGATVREAITALASPAPTDAVDNPLDTTDGPNGEWYCEDHPQHLQSHDGCSGAGVPPCTRIDLLLHQIRQMKQRLDEQQAMYGFLADQALATDAGVLRKALQVAEAALADIGDADREPGDNIQWAERRAAKALPTVREALTATPAAGGDALIGYVAADDLSKLWDGHDRWNRLAVYRSDRVGMDGTPKNVIPIYAISKIEQSHVQDSGAEEVGRMNAIIDAYKTWPDDIRNKLSLHDLRRMNGWTPRTNTGDWRIDTSAGKPILVHKDYSVIESEQARYVLALILRGR